MTGDGTPREREKALRELLALIAEVAVVPLPAVDYDRDYANQRAMHARQIAFAIRIEGAARAAANGDLRSIRIATGVLRDLTAEPLPYEPYQYREAGQ